MSGFVCLMYHDVFNKTKHESGFSGRDADVYKIDKRSFENQVRHINDFLIKKGLDKGLVRFTFDDGGESFLTVIAPTLEKYGFKGYFFIATGFLNKEGFLSDEQVAELSKRGHFVGSHSHTHRQMMNALSKEELLSDWKTSIDYLGLLIGKPILIASLPNGFSSTVILDVLQDLGIEDVYTSSPIDKPAKKGKLTLFGRYGIKDGMSERKVLHIAFNPLTKTMIKMKKIILKGAKSLLGQQYIKIREYLYKH